MLDDPALGVHSLKFELGLGDGRALRLNTWMLAAARRQNRRVLCINSFPARAKEKHQHEDHRTQAIGELPLLCEGGKACHRLSACLNGRQNYGRRGIPCRGEFTLDLIGGHSVPAVHM